MITRKSTAKIKPLPLGFAAVVVVSLFLTILNSNFLDVLSFSTTSTICLSSRHQKYTTIGNNYHDSKRDGFRITDIDNEEHKNRRLITTISSQKSDNHEQHGSARNKNGNNKYKDRQEQQQRERQRRELVNKLNRARDSICFYGQDSSEVAPASIQVGTDLTLNIVVTYTNALSQSASKSDIAPNLLDPWDFIESILEESRPVQERIVGLLAVMMQVITHMEEEYVLFNNSNNQKGEEMYNTTSKNIMDHLVFVQTRIWETSREVLRHMAKPQDRRPHVMSPKPITALAMALRESSLKSAESEIHSGREEIQELIQLVDDAKRNTGNEEESDEDITKAMASAWNLYLASLCDKALATKNPADTGLGIAAKLAMQTDCNTVVKSDIISYNTVMNIAAKVGNATLVDTMWKDMTAKREDGRTSLEPNSRTYNTRIMVTSDDAERLQILDKEIIPAAFQLQRANANATASAESVAVIDSFTIDMMMIPLLKVNRKKHLFQLIDHWMTLINRQHNINGSVVDYSQQKSNKNKAQRAFKNALAAFFITLVQKNGDVRTARELWNRYMVSSIDYSDENSNMNSDAFLRATNIVTPERRHYNILLDGYARLVDQVRDRQAREQFRILDDDILSSKGKENKKVKIWQASAASKSDEETDEPDVASTSEFYEEVQEKAIHDGQELFALMIAEQQRQNSRNKVGPDAYTKSTMIRLCRSGVEVQSLLQKTAVAASNRNTGQTWLPRAVTRAAVTTCGRLGDPSMSCMIFDQFMFPDFDSNSQYHLSNYRAFNVLLGALASGAKLDNPKLDVIPKRSVGNTPPSFLLSELHGRTCTEAVVRLLNLMTNKNSQTYCVAASALQYAPISERLSLSQEGTNSTTVDQKSSIGTVNLDSQESTPLALQLFYNATRDGIHADGRLVNAIFRCYGDNVAGALAGWKSDIRKATYDFEQKTNGKGANTKKNMLAAYNGLLYVCGRAERPDIAVRIVYAMKNKEGLDPSENPYYNYRSGKILRKNLVKRDKEESRWRGMLPKLDLVRQYENILYVECKKYDTRDRRMEKDDRIRIIV